MDPFISIADMNAFMETTLDPDALITAIALDSACTSVRSYLNQTINLVVDDVEIYSGTGKLRLRLRERPVREVSEILIDDTAVASTDYSLRDAIVTLTAGDLFTRGFDNIQVTYTHGYDMTADSSGEGLFVPADIRLVACSLARRILNAAGQASTAGIKSEQIGNYQYTLADEAVVAADTELLDIEKDVLDRYAVRLIP